MRSILDVVPREFAFSQRPLWDGRHFVEGARARGIALTAEKLERLLEVDLLEPLVAVVRDRTGLEQAAAAGEPFLWELANQSFSDRNGLVREYGEGQLLDGAGLDHVRAEQRKHSLGEVSFESPWYLYSPWQLLDLPELLTELTWVEAFPDENGEARRSRLPSRRARLIVLCGLEAAFWPQLSGVLRGGFGGEFHVYDEWRTPDRGEQELSWIGADLDDVEAVGLDLCQVAHEGDPLRDWFPLVASTAPSKRSTLRSAALLAMERRQGAEVLLRAVAEARGETTANQMARLQPDRAWRTRRLEAPDLEATLTSFGLSPHPSLIVVVEGAIDRLALSQVFAVLGIQERPDFIQIVDRHGVGQSLSALVDHVVVPRLGELERDGRIPLDRPLTRMLVVTDPEGPMRTAEQRRDAIAGWTTQVLAAVDTGKRPAVEDRVASELFDIITWNDQGDCFEFAHFDDDALGAAVARHDKRPRAKDADEWSVILRSVRSRQGSLNSLFGSANVQKSRVVADLMPSLVSRIADEDQSVKWVDSSVPIVRAAGHAARMASEIPRHGMGIRARPRQDAEDS